MNQTLNIVTIPEVQLRQLFREELTAFNCQPKKAETDPLLNVSQLQEYLKEKTGKAPKRQTIYDWVCKRAIPFEKHSKYLYFRRSTIDQWLENGRQSK